MEQESNQKKLEDEMRAQEAKEEAEIAYDSLQNQWKSEEKEYGYDPTNFEKFNKNEKKQILSELSSDETQEMTENMIDKML